MLSSSLVRNLRLGYAMVVVVRQQVPGPIFLMTPCLTSHLPPLPTSYRKHKAPSHSQIQIQIGDPSHSYPPFNFSRSIPSIFLHLPSPWTTTATTPSSTGSSVRHREMLGSDPTRRTSRLALHSESMMVRLSLLC